TASSRVRSRPASGFASASRSASGAATAPPEASSGIGAVLPGSYRTGPDLSSRCGAEQRLPGLRQGEVGDDEMADRAARARADGGRRPRGPHEPAREPEPEAEQPRRAIGGPAAHDVFGLDNQVAGDARAGVADLERDRAGGRPRDEDDLAGVG